MKKFIELFTILKAIVLNIFELDQKKAAKLSRFEYLDGYRGSLAIVVAISHTISDSSCEIFNATIAYSLTYAVAGFFMLSAFLLTHRLLNDLDRTEAADPRLVSLQIIKYTIRRFFRIYMVYVIFVVALKFGPSLISDHEVLTYESSFWEMATLGNAGKNHLWTIPAEIRYYFFIPIFCLAVYYLKKYKLIFLFACIGWTIYDQLFNFFNLSVDQLKFDYEKIQYLSPHFAVFFMGSQVALAYNIITKYEPIMTYIQQPWTQSVLNAVALIIGVLGLKANWWLLYDHSDFAYRSRATLYWSGALFLTLLSTPPNTIASFFGSCRILKLVGKYSFSFYLLHMGIGTFMRKFNFGDQLGLVSATMAITFIISFFTFYLIENPLIRVADYLCITLENHQFFSNQDHSRSKLLT